MSDFINMIMMRVKEKKNRDQGAHNKKSSMMLF